MSDETRHEYGLTAGARTMLGGIQVTVARTGHVFVAIPGADDGKDKAFFVDAAEWHGIVTDVGQTKMQTTESGRAMDRFVMAAIDLQETLRSDHEKECVCYE